MLYGVNRAALLNVRGRGRKLLAQGISGYAKSEIELWGGHT